MGKMTAPPILILGVGNILLSEDGGGGRVIKAMKGVALPDNVEVLDGGTGALDLIDVMAGRDKVIIIDAVKGGGQPGAIYRFGCDQLSQGNMPISSIHQWGLAEELNMMELLGISPRETVIIGVEPEQVDWGLEPSPTLKKRIPDIAALVLRELAPEKL